MIGLNHGLNRRKLKTPAIAALAVIAAATAPFAIKHFSDRYYERQAEEIVAAQNAKQKNPSTILSTLKSPEELDIERRIAELLKYPPGSILHEYGKEMQITYNDQKKLNTGITKHDAANRGKADVLYQMLDKDNKNVPEVLKNIWIFEYTDNGGNHRNRIEDAIVNSLEDGALEKAMNGFLDGLREMEAGGKRISPEHREAFLTTFLISIPESHWEAGSCSRTRSGREIACGLYQFTKPTATAYHIRGVFTDEASAEEALGEDGRIIEVPQKKGGKHFIIDNRSDPYLSAKAAAMLFYDNYLRYNRSIDLALAAYNSGMPITYQKISRRSNVPISFEGYVEFFLKIALRNEIEKSNPDSTNGVRKDILVKVKKGDTIPKLLKRNGISPTKMSIDLFAAANPATKGGLKAGKKVILPKQLLDQNNVEPQLQISQRAKNIVQNLNYPPKFWAVIEIIQAKYPELLDYVKGKLTYKGLEERLNKHEQIRKLIEKREVTKNGENGKESGIIFPDTSKIRQQHSALEEINAKRIHDFEKKVNLKAKIAAADMHRARRIFAKRAYC